MRLKGSAIIVLVLLLTSLVSASDIAYIYRKDYRIDNNILDVFNEMGYSYDLINEKNLPDFSDYKIIFIGDEILKNADKIPIDKKTSIIVNYYHGDTFGLTDYDGISKLGSTSPLEVRKDGKIIEVYTVERYYIGSEAIAYYFLDNKNKAEGMVRIASTWVGLPETGFGSQFGDVISYAYPGTELENGKTIQQRVCFFGIVESDYWTPEAREMFKDCVGFISIVCNKDSDCGEYKEETYCKNNNVYKDTTSYECVNPGETDSYCEEDEKTELIEECYECEDGECVDECVKDSDCDDGLFCDGMETCNNGECESGQQVDCSVFNIPSIAGCNTSLDDNPLTWDYSGGRVSYCSEDINGCVIENPEEDSYCEENCGAECDIDSDCPEKCTQESHKLYTIKECNNCECEYSGYECVIGKCGAVCEVNADCLCEQDYCNGTTLVDYPENSSCGTSGSEGCLCSDCVPDLIEDSPGCGYVEEYCGDGIVDGDEDCEPPNTDTCNSNCQYEDLSCIEAKNLGLLTGSISEGTGKVINNWYQDYEVGLAVYRKFDEIIDNQEIFDYDVGEVNGNSNLTLNVNLPDCKYQIDLFCGPVLLSLNGTRYGSRLIVAKSGGQEYCHKDECQEDSDCGEDYCTNWEYYCSGDDVYKSRTCYEYNCDDGYCYENVNEQDVFVEECGYGCSSGECIEHIECYSNSDCGNNGCIGIPNYCIGNEVYQDWIYFECVNPGTPGSYCINHSSPLFIRDCGESYCEDWDYYCDENEARKRRTCYNEGCEDGACYSEENVEDVFIEECYECQDGGCVDECEEDSDCGEDHYSDSYCENDYYKDFHDFSCVQGKCEEETTKILLEECGESYCEDWEYYCKCWEQWRKRTCYNKGCDDGCFNNQHEENELVEKCDFLCCNGECFNPFEICDIDCNFKC